MRLLNPRQAQLPGGDEIAAGHHDDRPQGLGADARQLSDHVPATPVKVQHIGASHHEIGPGGQLREPVAADADVDPRGDLCPAGQGPGPEPTPAPPRRRCP